MLGIHASRNARSGVRAVQVRHFSQVRVAAIAVAIALMAPLTVVLLSPSNQAPAYANPSCTSLSLINGDFEATLPDPKPNYNYYWGNYFDASNSQVPGMGWLTTQSNHEIEFWAGDPILTEASGPVAYDGNAFVELNASQVGALYQDIATVPGTQIVWSLAHRGRSGVDTMAVKIGEPSLLNSLGAATASFQQGPNLSDGTAAWGVHTGIYLVPSSQTTTRFWFESVSSVGGVSYGNFLDGISFTPYNCSAETPTYSPPTIASTADGFTFQLTNYQPAGMTASTTVGRVVISPSGLVTLTEVPAGTSASVTVTNHYDGFVDASVSVNANSLGSALVPKFETPVGTDDGFTAQIINYDENFTWTVATTDSSSATITREGLVVVSNDPSPSTVVPVTTARSSYLTGSAFIQSSSVRLPPVVFVPVVAPPPPSSYSEPAPIATIPKVTTITRKPVTFTIKGFDVQATILKKSMKKRINRLMARYGDYKLATITGLTQEPLYVRKVSDLSGDRARVTARFIKSQGVKNLRLKQVADGRGQDLGSKIRGIQIRFTD